MTRTPLLIGAALTVAALTVPAQAEELRIGFIAPMTGIFAQVGKDMVNGFQMYLDDHKGGEAFGGATVKFILEDDQAKPDTGVTKAKKLVLSDKVHMFIGGVLASTGYALAPVSTELKTIYIASVPAADDLTQRQIGKYPYFIRTGWSSLQTTHPMGQWACEQGYKKIATVSADYAFGYEQVGGFLATRSRSSAAAPAMTSSPCPSWAARSSATCRRCNIPPPSTRRRTKPS